VFWRKKCFERSTEEWERRERERIWVWGGVGEYVWGLREGEGEGETERQRERRKRGGDTEYGRRSVWECGALSKVIVETRETERGRERLQSVQYGEYGEYGVSRYSVTVKNKNKEGGRKSGKAERRKRAVGEWERGNKCMRLRCIVPWKRWVDAWGQGKARPGKVERQRGCLSNCEGGLRDVREWLETGD
jgi:hypothetical protein